MTYSVLYLTLYIHKANRNAQHTILSQSSLLLNTIVEPQPPAPLPPAYEVRRAGLAEVLKDRWNSEVEKLVHNVQTTDWSQKREDYEQRIANAWSNVRQTDKAQGLEQRFKENVVGVAEAANQQGQAMNQIVDEAKDSTGQPRLLELK